MTQPRPGRPHKLNAQQYIELDDVIQKDASEFGYDIWESDSVSEYVRQNFKQMIAGRTARRILRRMGFTQ